MTEQESCIPGAGLRLLACGHIVNLHVCHHIRYLVNLHGMNLSILCGTNPSVREEQQQDSEWDILGVRIDSTLKNLNLAPRSRQAVVFALTQRINSPIFARGLET